MSKESEALNYLVSLAVAGNRENHRGKIFESQDIIKNALKRNEPMKPIWVKDCSYIDWVCPSCRGHNVLDEEYRIKWKYCSDCGQRLNWSDK